MAAFKAGDRVRVRKPKPGDVAAQPGLVWSKWYDEIDGTVQPVKDVHRDGCVLVGSATLDYVCESSWLTLNTSYESEALAAALQRAEAAEKDAATQREEKCRAYREAQVFQESAIAAEKRAAEAEANAAHWLDVMAQEQSMRNDAERRAAAAEDDRGPCHWCGERSSTGWTEEGIDAHLAVCPKHPLRRVEALEAENARIVAEALGIGNRLRAENERLTRANADLSKRVLDQGLTISALKDEAVTLRKHRAVVHSALGRAGFDVVVVSEGGVLKALITKEPDDTALDAFCPIITAEPTIVRTSYRDRALKCADCATAEGVTRWTAFPDPLCPDCGRKRAHPPGRLRRALRWFKRRPKAPAKASQYGSITLTTGMVGGAVRLRRGRLRRALGAVAGFVRRDWERTDATRAFCASATCGGSAFSASVLYAMAYTSGLLPW